jgi:hypothetical protein
MITRLTILAFAAFMFAAPAYAGHANGSAKDFYNVQRSAGKKPAEVQATGSVATTAPICTGKTCKHR